MGSDRNVGRLRLGDGSVYRNRRPVGDGGCGMTDAKPGRCPFCGSEDSVGVGIKPKTILRHGYCLSCGSDGPLCDTIAEAIAAWNAPRERIAELEALNGMFLSENENLKKRSNLLGHFADVYDCKKCNGPVARGYQCIHCGDSDPSEPSQQEGRE